MRTLAAILGLVLAGAAAADELPVAWTDELPVAWADSPPAFTAGPVAAPAALPPIDFDLSALQAMPVAPHLAAWNSHPLNVGSCPCKATGGCRCDPHSDCKAGRCALHNPALASAPAPVVIQPRYFVPIQR